MKGVRIPAGLVLPRNAMPNFNCEVCGAGFYERDVFVRHVTRCVKRHSEELAELARQNEERDPLYHATDWEALAFQQRNYGHLLRR